jgi:signal transduction histidine kinase
MKWLFRAKWVLGGFGLSVLMLGILSLISYRNATLLAESTGKVTQTQDVLEALTDITAHLNEAEAGRRGYIFLGDEVELTRYTSSIQKVNPKVEQIRKLVADNPAQQERLIELTTLLADQISLFQESIQIYQSNPDALSAQTQLISASNDKHTAIQQVIADMRNREERELEQWVNQFQTGIRLRMLIELLGTILSFAILSGIYAVLYFQTLKRQQAESMQRALQQEKELTALKLDFFSMVSHEFRTPLSIIMGSSQLLAEQLQLVVKPEKLKSLYRIQSSARLMTKLLTDILTLARAEAGKLEYDPQWVEMQSFCLNLLEDLQLSQGNHAAIRFDQHGNCTHAKVDERLLYSILSNLLSNAMKYSPQTGEILFRLICNSDAVTFEVHDQGLGISSDEQANLYKPFYRGKNVRGITGTGLGLAVVKKCLELHHGELVVESRLGTGSMFRVTIPQHQHHEE